jgi:hypothetical protein
LRIAILAITLVFIALLGALTVADFIKNGVTGVGILAVLVLLLFSVGIVGALWHPPDRR